MKKKKNKKLPSTNTNASSNKPESNASAREIAPHFDTPTSTSLPDPNAEISKASIGTGFETDSRPR